MATTSGYGFKKPARTDYYNIDDQNGNWDAADAALSNLQNGVNAKVNTNGGNVAETVVSTVTDSTASFPMPAAGDRLRVMWGKVKKWQQDCMAKFGNYVLTSMITSQYLNDTNRVSSAALSYALKQLIDQNSSAISTLNANLAGLVDVAAVTIQNGNGRGVLDISQYKSGCKVVLPIVSNSSSLQWNISVAVQNNLLIISGPGVVEGYTTEIILVRVR